MTIQSAVSVSAYVTLMASVAILVVGLPLALFLARARTRVRHFFEVLLLFPLLMPPTVLGYFLLVILGTSVVMTPTFPVQFSSPRSTVMWNSTSSRPAHSCNSSLNRISLGCLVP